MIRKILLFIFMIAIIVFTILIQDYGGYNKHPTILQILCNLFISFFYGYGLGSFLGYFANNKKE